MKAMIIESIGSANVFKEVQLDKPTVSAGQLLIEVKATSINPIDVMLRSVDTPWSENLPKVLHGDVAGIVTAVGEGVTSFKVGDEVYGCAGGISGVNGALAEFMLVDHKLIAKKPKNISMQEAAALPLVAITAWEALIDKMKIAENDHVLIHGAAGGVGHIAVQLAKYLGAFVSATATTRTFEKAKTLGADNVINANLTSVETYVQELTAGHGFDAVFDTVAGDNINKSFEAVKFNGAVATILPIADPLQIALKGLSFHSVLMLIPLTQKINQDHHGYILTKIVELVEQGYIKPLLDDEKFSIWDVSKAHTYFESGKAIGKVVLENS